jgi:GNAT superfamily N-acetyltransferase
MELTSDLKSSGFSFMDTSESDLDDYIHVERISHSKYVIEHSDFFGEWNEEILVDVFHCKRELTFFQKLLLHDKVVGFFGYDQKDDRIDNVFIRIIEKAQNKGLGTLFLSNLKKLSKEIGKPIFIATIKTNPAQHLYQRLGFDFYKEEDVFYFFRFDP